MAASIIGQELGQISGQVRGGGGGRGGSCVYNGARALVRGGPRDRTDGRRRSSFRGQPGRAAAGRATSSGASESWVRAPSLGSVDRASEVGQP